MTELVLDGEGAEHYYCQHCDEEILDTLSSYEDEDDEWYVEDHNPYEEENSELDQDYSYLDGT
jgi:hypothetical protein